MPQCVFLHCFIASAIPLVDTASIEKQERSIKYVGPRWKSHQVLWMKSIKAWFEIENMTQWWMLKVEWRATWIGKVNPAKSQLGCDSYLREADNLYFDLDLQGQKQKFVKEKNIYVIEPCTQFGEKKSDVLLFCICEPLQFAERTGLTKLTVVYGAQTGSEYEFTAPDYFLVLLLVWPRWTKVSPAPVFPNSGFVCFQQSAALTRAGSS